MTFAFVAPFRAQAATVGDDYGQTITVVDPAPSDRVGDIFLVLDPNGKKKALVRITEIKRTSVTAEVIKGHASSGWRLTPYTGKVKKTQEPNVPQGPDEQSEYDRTSVVNVQGTSDAWMIDYRVGLGIGYFTITSSASTGASFGYTLGAAGQGLAEIARGRWGIEAGLELIQMGYAINQTIPVLSGGTTQVKGTLTLDYLTIPVLAKYAVVSGNSFEFDLKGGLMEGFVVTKKATQTVNGATTSVSGSAVTVASLDTFLVVGPEFGIVDNANELRYSLDILYTMGLTNINQGLVGGGTIKNQGFTMMAGVTF